MGFTKNIGTIIETPTAEIATAKLVYFKKLWDSWSIELAILTIWDDSIWI